MPQTKKEKIHHFSSDISVDDDEFYDNLKKEHNLGSNRELLHFLRLLYEGKPLPIKEQPISQTFDAPCSYRDKDDKGKPFCRNKKAPIITKFLTSTACLQCLLKRIENMDTVYGYCPYCGKSTAMTIIRDERIPTTKCQICGVSDGQPLDLR